MPLPIGKLISTTPALLSHGGLRPVIFGVMFAILLSPDSVLVLCFGLTGSSDVKAALESAGIEFIGTPRDRPGIRFALPTKSRD